MTPIRFACVASLMGSFLGPMAAIVAQDEHPRSLDPRLKIELFAENPQIATPTGMDVDHAGRVWAIESNTHFPPEGYAGHPTDRVLVLEDANRDHKADRITVFKDGLTHTMSIAVKPVWLDVGNEFVSTVSETDSSFATKPAASSLEVFIATRREILLCTDTDGDLQCDATKSLIRLETQGNYPHNGLAGFAFDAMGHLFFGFGENLGADYSIIGSDGTTLSGGGEGGNVYRCLPDGSKLEQWATGFWNPHASCFDAFGHMFTVDNDPDSRPPCRLLHIVPDGDYGYRFRNGRKGTHPFTCWNGEIPGTLPMVSGTGESPSGVVCYESDSFPEDYLGTLLVGSWGDHRIDKFVLKPRGASFESIPQPVIRGGENFRPVGLALAPDGSLYFTDWVLREYKLHGKGRIWRVSAADESTRPEGHSPTVPAAGSIAERSALLNSPTLAVRRTAARTLAQFSAGRTQLIGTLNSSAGERSRVESLWALARVPVTVQQLDLLIDHNRFLSLGDGVTEAALRLSGTSQLTGPIPNLVGQPMIFNLVIHSLSSTNPQARISGEWLERYVEGKGNLAGLPIMLAMENPDPFMRHHVFRRLLNSVSAGKLRQPSDLEFTALPDQRGASLVVLQVIRYFSPRNVDVLKQAFHSPWNDVRRAAVQWAGEEKLTELRPDVEKILASEPMTGDLFIACLASLSLLDGILPAEFEKAPPVQHILPIVRDAERSAALRAIALRMLPPSLKELDGPLLGGFVTSNDELLRREAVRTLAQSTIPEREPLLQTVVENETLDPQLRADAVAGLSPLDGQTPLSDATLDLLVTLLHGSNEALSLEALRTLRGSPGKNPELSRSDPRIAAALKHFAATLKKQGKEVEAPAIAESLVFANGQRLAARLSQSEIAALSETPSGNPEAGRRTFFRTNGAGCFKCHAIGGRGGQVGPDLTGIARTMDRQKLVMSILEPSREISPQFTSWSLETTNGKVVTGMLLGEELNGDLRLGDQNGAVFFVPFHDIVTRVPTNTSIMPDGLHQMLTRTELSDLVAYLETLK